MNMLHADSRRGRKLMRLAVCAIGLLMAKILLVMLYEYRGYFPADFESTFLLGRRETFTGWYRIAFYAHIVFSPLAFLLSTALMISGGRARFRGAHRLAGRVLVVIVVLLGESQRIGDVGTRLCGTGCGTRVRDSLHVDGTVRGDRRVAGKPGTYDLRSTLGDANLFVAVRALAATVDFRRGSCLQL
ncbi:hypothetical protein Pla52nx_004986 [Stieleria varia]|uniref:Uncharacterized protein n=1 Tax=Stieleria varia TaxID=2528005 RepID=A0A5C6AZM1_9BACT|nr:hypothetical protein [Stieleria varia]TWU05098.1 hypothetical protein Pla52n_31440 [Stieleria varia]